LKNWGLAGAEPNCRAAPLADAARPDLEFVFHGIFALFSDLPRHPRLSRLSQATADVLREKLLQSPSSVLHFISRLVL
jgi:hypothetical protein